MWIINLIKRWFGVDFVVIPSHPEVEASSEIADKLPLVEIVTELVAKQEPQLNISEPVYSFVKYFKKNRKSFNFVDSEIIDFGALRCKHGHEYGNTHSPIEVEDKTLLIKYKVNVADIFELTSYTGRYRSTSWYVSERKFESVYQINGEDEVKLEFLTTDELYYLQAELWRYYKKVLARSETMKFVRAQRVQRQEYIDIYCKPSL